MNERGYPVEDFESNAAIVSVDHGDVAQNFRDGHRVYLASQHGAVSTDDMRRGIVSYRTLFMELLDEAVPSDAVSH
jgi:hypothetical protein